MRKNLCEKCCVGTVIYNDKCGKTAVRETVDAEINNVIYMELYSGAKMADRKTYVAGSIDRENTVYKNTIFNLPDRIRIKKRDSFRWKHSIELDLIIGYRWSGADSAGLGPSFSASLYSVITVPNFGFYKM
jgi:hypothetical protein